MAPAFDVLCRCMSPGYRVGQSVVSLVRSGVSQWPLMAPDLAERMACYMLDECIFRRSSGNGGGGDSHWLTPARRGGCGRSSLSRRWGLWGLWGPWGPRGLIGVPGVPGVLGETAQTNKTQNKQQLNRNTERYLRFAGCGGNEKRLHYLRLGSGEIRKSLSLPNPLVANSSLLILLAANDYTTADWVLGKLKH